jgi:hypothetical protein
MNNSPLRHVNLIIDIPSLKPLITFTNLEAILRLVC